jgi:hypothetical protein
MGLMSIAPRPSGNWANKLQPQTRRSIGGEIGTVKDHTPSATIQPQLCREGQLAGTEGRVIKHTNFCI